MLKILLKKQLKEVGAFLYYDAKKGKRRNTKNIVGYSLILLFLFLSVASVFYMVADWIGKPMFLVHLDWLFWVMMGLISIALGVFGSVFNTYTTVYLAKDNEMLLSMPIKKNQLLLARLFGVYVMGLFYTALVYIPAMIVAWIYGGFSIQLLVSELIMLFVLSFIVLSLSALLGWGVAVISVHLRNKSFVTVIASLIFIAAYYYVYFKAAGMIKTLIANADKVARSVKSKGFIIYHMGMAITGNVCSILIQIAFVSVVTLVVYLLLWKSFTKILTMKKGEKRVAVKEITALQKSVDQALLRKEALRFTKSANYMLNCGLGSIMIVLAGIAILVKGDQIELVMKKWLVSDGTLTALAIAAVCMLATMNDMTAPSISMEGKNLWIAQSIPVSGWQVLKAKLKLHVYITLPPVLFCGCCVGYVMKMNLTNWVEMLAMASLFVLFTATNGLVIGLKMPNLNWTNEIVALKQSFGVFLALFGNWILLVGIGAAGYSLRYQMSVETYMLLVFVVIVIACKVMLSWLKKKGSKEFERL